MTKVLRCGWCLWISLFVFSVVPRSFAQPDDLRWLIEPELLRAGGLEIVWQTRLPLKKPEKIEELFIVGNRIYALSELNYLVSLNRENGNVIFSSYVGPSGFPVVGLELYEDELFSIIGNDLVQINPDFGTELERKRLDFAAVGLAARNGSCFYIAGTDRRLHALRANDKVELFEVAARSDSVVTSTVADEQFVIFATNAGNVIRITPDGPKQIWEFNADGPVSGAVVRDAESLFFASGDTNVYKLDILTGKLVWNYQADALLQRGPRVAQEALYQYIPGKGLAAIDKNDGSLIWKLPDGLDLLAENKHKAYVITNEPKLVVMDNEKGERLYSINFIPVSRYVSNRVDSRIYIADDSGRVACLKPVE